uniref:Secreted protein n=1 Tax=Anopheles atroparvus TaxID=41427 RepID=A0A182IY52_ANOAO
MMKLVYGWLVLGLLYRSALGVPRPDFGIDGDIAGSAKVQTVAGDAGANFDQIDLKTISLETHYTRLFNLETDLTTIGGQIATTGKDLTDRLEALAISNGPMPNDFTAASGALDSLRTLLQSGLATQTDSIETMVGTYITDMLTDATEDLLGTLNRLETELGRLQTGIVNAIAAYDSPTVPAVFIRRYVSPKVIYELLRALHDLQSQLPLVTYIIELTLGHLESADIYLASVMERATATVYEVLRHYGAFKTEIINAAFIVSDSIATPIRLTYSAQINDLAFAMPDLEELDAYDTVLEPVLTAYEEALGITNRDIIALSAETTFTTYLQGVVSLDDYLDRFYDEKLCTPMQSVMQVLIASGPWADYCFSKYSPRLTELLAVNSNRFLMCYEIEADRLQRLYELVERLVKQLLFDVENLAEDVLSCHYRQERGSDCIALIGPYYLELGQLLVDKQTDLTNIIDYETKASFNRMAACVNGGKCGFIASAEDVVAEIQACELAGPLAV